MGATYLARWGDTAVKHQRIKPFLWYVSMLQHKWLLFLVGISFPCKVTKRTYQKKNQSLQHSQIRYIQNKCIKKSQAHIKDGRNECSKEKYLDKGVLSQIFSCVIMRSRKMWPTKKNTGYSFFAIPIHTLNLAWQSAPTTLELGKERKMLFRVDKTTQNCILKVLWNTIERF